MDCKYNTVLCEEACYDWLVKVQTFYLMIPKFD